MSTTGKTSELHSDGHYNKRQQKFNWNSTFNSLQNIICTLRGLIENRDGCKECNGRISSG